jgi:hypothetical protein
VVEALRRGHSLKLKRNADNQPWVFQEYLQLVPDAAYKHQRNHLMGMMPDALKFPFRIDQRQTLAEVLGITPKDEAGLASAPGKKQGGTLKTRATRVETLRSGDAVKHRVHFDYLEDDKVLASGYVDVDPKLAWLITKGWAKSQSANQAATWTIEYGEPVNGVPVLKKYTNTRVTVDEKTGAEKPVADNPTTVTVDLAEPYQAVNPAEYTAAFYNVEMPDLYDPYKSTDTPKELYYILGGVAAFIVLVLVLHFARRKPRPADAVTPAPNAPLS